MENEVLTAEQIAEQKSQYIEELRKVDRAGIEAIIAWLESSDFFTAPASTRYHGAYEGGLCQHSLKVLECLRRLYTEADDEKLIVAALLHDLCKANFYTVEMRNKKIDGKWESIPAYTVDEKFHFGGHGSKSMFIASSFITLMPDEAIAINAHMGTGFHSESDARAVSDAYEHCPLAFWLHVADEEATYIYGV